MIAQPDKLSHAWPRLSSYPNLLGLGTGTACTGSSNLPAVFYCLTGQVHSPAGVILRTPKKHAIYQYGNPPNTFREERVEGRHSVLLQSSVPIDFDDSIIAPYGLSQLVSNPKYYGIPANKACLIGWFLSALNPF